jgi:SAM-dependent methyltransferase
MSYAELTRNTREPLKRIVHSNRLEAAARIIPLRADQKILDYGCGDGGLFHELVKHVPVSNLHGFDPYLLGEMTIEGVTAYDNTDDLISNHRDFFDVVFCTEVCEHLNQNALTKLFDNIRACSKKDGIFVFGVPIETGFSGFAKNMYRVSRGRRQNATLGRALKSLVSGYIPRAHDRNGWIGSHIGFDCQYFREQLVYGGFDVVNSHYLPWPKLGPVINNEVYFVCKRNQQYGQ